MKTAKSKARTFLEFTLIWMSLFGVCILVRLPHLLSGNSFPDEDEAIIGIMAQDFLNGELFPYYFYGQNYGMSFFEVISTAFFEKLIGSSIWTLRLGGLLLYSLGVAFLVKTMLNKKIQLTLLVAVTFILVAFPAWYLWGSFVRGGYVTAFAVSGAIFYLTQSKELNWKTGLATACLIAIGYESHVLILIPVMALVVFWCYESKDKFKLGILVSFLSILFIFFLRKIFIDPKLSLDIPYIGSTNYIMNFTTNIQSWFAGMSGYYFFSVKFDPPKYWQIGLLILVGLIVIFLVYNFLKAKLSAKARIFLLFGSTLVTLLLLAISSADAPRYFIGFYSGIMTLLVYSIVQVPQGKIGLSLIMSISALCFIGITAGSKMERHWYLSDVNQMDDINLLFEKVKKSNARAVIALDNQFMWNYFYGSEIPACNLCWEQRTNRFSKKVKILVRTNPESIAFVGYRGILWRLDEIPGFMDNYDEATTNYFINRNFNKSYLAKGKEFAGCN